MVIPAAGSVVLLPFPFSDLSQTKLRPAVVLANADRGDWILCQITSAPYADPRAVFIATGDFVSGSLRIGSYARPGKLFIANETLMTSRIGTLNDVAFDRIVDAVIDLLQPPPVAST